MASLIKTGEIKSWAELYQTCFTLEWKGGLDSYMWLHTATYACMAGGKKWILLNGNS